MNVLFLGLGGVGQRHLRNLKSLVPDASVSAVRHLNRKFAIGADLKADPLVNIVEDNEITIYSSIEEAVTTRFDCAVVANPSSKHLETCLALVERGIPVFLEKPAATHRDGLEALRSLVSLYNVQVMVGYQLRWHPCVCELKKLLDAGRIGAIQSVEIAVYSYLPSWHPYEQPKDFYAGVKDLGGGVILTEIHEIDLLCWLIGRPTIVYATGGKVSGLDIDVEDTVAAAMEVSCRGRSIPVSLLMSFMQTPPSRRFVINGERGRMILELSAARLTIESENGGAEFFNATDYDRNSMFVDELSHFIACLKTGDEPLTSLNRTCDGLLTAFAIRESLETRQPIKP